MSGVFSSWATLALSRPRLTSRSCASSLRSASSSSSSRLRSSTMVALRERMIWPISSAGDQAVVHELVIAIAMLGGLIGAEHEAQRTVDVERHDGGFKREHGQDVDGAEHDKEVGFGAVGQVGVKGEVDAQHQQGEEDIVQHHKLGPHFEVAEQASDTLRRPQHGG